MRTEGGLLRGTPGLAGRLLLRVAGTVLRWLLASVQAAAFWALFALVMDAVQWSPVFVAEPAARLRWVVLFGALTGAGQLLHEWEARRRAEQV
jgi:hypothetical protein